MPTLNRKKWAAHKEAQRMTPRLTVCEVCGKGPPLQRHHPDYDDPNNVEILCQSCHIKADQRDGHRETKQLKNCKLCGAEFMPTHSKKHNLCSPKCRSEMGRRNAMKRWHPGRQNPTADASQAAFPIEWTDLEPSATQSSLPLSRKSDG